MDKKTKIAFIGSAAVIMIIVIALAFIVVDKLTPSKETMPLTEYYEVGEKEVLVILQDEIYEKKGLLLNGTIYIDYDTVVQQFNHRFYWDYNENILTYTTPNEILQTEAGSSEYSVTKSMIKTDTAWDYPIVEVFADQVFLSLEFVKKYSDLTFQYYENPSRVVINYQW